MALLTAKWSSLLSSKACDGLPPLVMRRESSLRKMLWCSLSLAWGRIFLGLFTFVSEAEPFELHEDAETLSIFPGGFSVQSRLCSFAISYFEIWTPTRTGRNRSRQDCINFGRYSIVKKLPFGKYLHCVCIGTFWVREDGQIFVALSFNRT